MATNGVKQRGPKQQGHRVVRHEPVERPWPGLHVEHGAGVVESHETDDECGNAQRGNDRDHQSVAGEYPGERPRPRIGLVRVIACLGQYQRHVDVELMRRRKLTIDVAGTAGMAEIGEIIEVTVRKRAPHFHGRKHRAQAFAVTAGIADRHQPVRFSERASCVHDRPLPFPRSSRTRCRSSCRCRPRNPGRAHCRP
jgi:hypothetical protein